jgi:HK97 family phage prohead protease
MMNRKALRGRAMVKDATQGIAELVISVYGNVDFDRDIVEQGACAKQIAGEYGPNPKGMLDHDWSMRSAVAKTLRWWEEPDGTHVEAQYNLEKEIGRDAFSDLQFYGDDMEFSVGYEVKARRAPNDDEKALGAKQVITEWQINEWSHVMLGANSATRLVGAKAKTEQGQKAVTEKSVVGSYEYLTDRITEALKEQFAAAWLWVRATFADHVVFGMERTDEMGDWFYATYDVPFTVDGDAYSFGEPVEVRTAEVIEAKSAEPPTEPETPEPVAINPDKVREFELLLVTT